MRCLRCCFSGSSYLFLLSSSLLMDLAVVLSGESVSGLERINLFTGSNSDQILLAQPGIVFFSPLLAIRIANYESEFLLSAM